eukprot:symbB.v1.2.026644.t1/scaffold2679.1/size73150/1
MELGRHLEISETDLRWLQGELDKLRQASGGIRAEIVHLREVKDAVNELPPEDSKASRMSVGRGSLERFATLQRRLATVAPQLMPLCTRARSSMEELLECCERLEERQKRLEQVAPSEGAPQGLSRVSKASGAMEQRHKVLPRSRSVETVGARSARSVATTAARGASPRQDPSVPGSAAGRDNEVTIQEALQGIKGANWKKALFWLQQAPDAVVLCNASANSCSKAHQWQLALQIASQARDGSFDVIC